jgi:hypothetical protein
MSTKNGKISEAAMHNQRKNNARGGGKSGKFSYLTSDNRFIVQTISENEKYTLIKNIGRVYYHLKYNYSFLCKFYGLYEISGKNMQSINVVLMKNNSKLVGANNRMALTIELKGHTLERQNLFGNDFLKVKTKIDVS